MQQHSASDTAFIDEINKKFEKTSKSRASRNEPVSRTLDENEDANKGRKLGKTPSVNPYYDFSSDQKSKRNNLKASVTAP